MIDRKPGLHRAILHILSTTYSTGTTDAAIRDALKGLHRTPGKNELETALRYLEGKSFIELARDDEHEMSVAHLTATGLDVLDGAVSDVGVEPAPETLTALATTRDVRRGIISISAEFGGWVRDREFSSEFLRMGTYEHLLLETIRLHLWYLAEKGYLETQRISLLAGSASWLAQITPAGHDLNDGRVTDPGITS